jgi:hypothetical protein
MAPPGKCQLFVFLCLRIDQVRDGIHLQIEIAISTDLTSHIFKRNVYTVLIPTAEAYRGLFGCEKKPDIIVNTDC